MPSVPQTVTTRPGTPPGANETTTVPPGYKQTEVGIIQKDWEICSLEEITDPKEPICYGIVQVGPFSSNGIPVLAIKNLNTDYRTNVHHCSPEIEAPYARSRVHPGDILISVKGTTGRVGIVPAHFEGNISRDLARMRLRDGHLPEYWFQMFQSSAAQRALDSATVGTTRLEISIGVLKQIKLPFPSLGEQRAIAEALSDVDQLLESLEKLIAKKRAIKQAAMQQLLAGKTRLPGFSREWETIALGGLEQRGDIKLYRGKVISQKDIDRLPGDYPIYSSSVHLNGLFGSYGDYMFDEELITWSVDGGGHLFHRPKHRFSVTNVCGYLRIRTPSIDYHYLAYHLQNLHSRKVFDYTVKAHPSVIRGAYNVALPRLSEQTAIATVLSDMDAEIAALERRRDKTRAVKQGMMQQLLTGRVRLVRPEPDGKSSRV